MPGYDTGGFLPIAKQSQAAYDMDYIKKYLEQEYYLVRLKDETASVAGRELDLRRIWKNISWTVMKQRI